MVETAPKPGVTRMLKWVRLGEGLDLLDAPGVIPAAFDDQIAAQRLAMCNDIGEAAYIDSLVAAALIIRMRTVAGARSALRLASERYKVDARAGSAEDVVAAVADRLFFGDVEKAGTRILNDFRGGLLGTVALELPEDVGRRGVRVAQLEQRRLGNAAAELEVEGLDGEEGGGGGGEDV